MLARDGEWEPRGQVVNAVGNDFGILSARAPMSINEVG
jgi:hypothetical protein